MLNQYHVIQKKGLSFIPLYFHAKLASNPEVSEGLSTISQFFHIDRPKIYYILKLQCNANVLRLYIHISLKLKRTFVVSRKVKVLSLLRMVLRKLYTKQHLQQYIVTKMNHFFCISNPTKRRHIKLEHQLIKKVYYDFRLDVFSVLL